MATISNLGVGVPGLSDLYDKLQAAEETKLTAIAKQKTTYDAQITGYGKLQSALTTLQTAAAKLAKTDTGTLRPFQAPTQHSPLSVPPALTLATLLLMSVRSRKAGSDDSSRHH